MGAWLQNTFNSNNKGYWNCPFNKQTIVLSINKPELLGTTGDASLLPLCKLYFSSLPPKSLFSWELSSLWQNPTSYGRQLKPSDYSIVCISCSSPSFQGETMCCYSFMVLRVMFWRTSYRNQSSLCTSVEKAPDSYKDWVLICLLSKNGSPYLVFFSFVWCFMNASLLLSQDLRVAARWVDRITDVQP